MWGKLIKGVGTLGTKMMANKGNIAMGVASSGFNAWGGPSGADEEEFQKAMEQLQAEGLMKGEDGSGGPIDPNDMMEFWKKNYYDAVHRYEDITRPFNGVNDADRTAALNEPLMRLRINLAEAYCTTPSMEYMAARRVLREKFPE
jgi:hypothetical protein